MKEKSGKGYRFDENGWIYLHIEGDAFERGFQHGYLAASEIKRAQHSLKYLIYINTGKTWEFFVDAACSLFLKVLESDENEEFLDKYPQWGYLKGYLSDRPHQEWTHFSAGQKK